MRNNHTNIVRIKAVNQALSKLEREIVFVGGAVVSLYADRSAAEIRETQDVDVLVEIYTRYEYSRLEEKLRSLGFQLDTNSFFVGRFINDNIIIDFMPLEKEVLGFCNRWYIEGFKHSIDVKLDEWNTVKIFPAPYFLAAKIEAFKSRGKNRAGEFDGRFSSDFEDIVFVLTNRSLLWAEIESSSDDLKKYLFQEFTSFSENLYFEEWIDALTEYNSNAAQSIVMPGIKFFLNNYQEVQ